MKLTSKGQFCKRVPLKQTAMGTGLENDIQVGQF